MDHSPHGKGERDERLKALAATLRRIYYPEPLAIPEEMKETIARLREMPQRH
jgi:hypothetical protein